MLSGSATALLNIASLAVAYPVYLHFLGYEKYGVWLILATVLSFAQLGNLGISQAIMKLVAEEHVRNNIENIQKYVMTAIIILVISGSTAFTIILIFKTQIVSIFNLTDENYRIALWMLPYIGVLSIYVFVVQTINSTLSGLGRMDQANYSQALGRIIAVSIATLMLYNGNGIVSILFGNAASYIFIHYVNLICIKRTANLKFVASSNICLSHGKKIIAFGCPLFSSSLIAMFLVPFNKVIISRYIGVSSVPVFEIAFNGTMQLRGIIEAGLRTTMPEISRISADMTKKGRDKIKEIQRKGLKLILTFGLAFYGIIMLTSPWLLHLWLGEKYNPYISIAFRIMLLGTYFSLIGVPAFYILMGMGRVKYILWANIFQSLSNTIIVIFFVLTFTKITLTTVCLSCLIGMLLSSIYLILKQRKTMDNY